MSQAEGISAAMSRSRGAVVRPQQPAQPLAVLDPIDRLRLATPSINRLPKPWWLRYK
jgi:hypothetical protein